MDTQAQQLTASLTAAFNGGGASSRPWLWQPLLQVLAQGRPVTVEQIAQATGRTADKVREALTDSPDTEYDEHGSIVGSGLTQNPTPHRYETGGHTLYTWCAMDTLIFPTVLAATAHVNSPCHATGTPVRLTVEPDRVTSVEPATAVVSIVTPNTCASIRAAFCNQVHFFADPESATDWLDQHPGATVMPVADAYDLGRPLTQALLAGAGHQS
ncbi:organomercurial lyase MerB [Rhodococcus marinonascens]|uniref:organomercurial lyase MerB n=1 Tax=Rhodococcus marinonascens TaxID=38311 RepID=UPI0009335D87|nr:organomercurial lyase MerB [Rhodococcus marinonascens]